MGEAQSERVSGAASGRSQWVSRLMVVLGAVAAVIGLVLLLVPSEQATIGWFAYAPLSETAFVPPSDLLTPQRQIGIILLVVGFASASFGAGWALGRGHAAGQRRLPDPSSPDA